ncbi:MAG: hypothetical protein ACE5HI_18310 [bacterium]
MWPFIYFLPPRELPPKFEDDGLLLKFRDKLAGEWSGFPGKRSGGKGISRKGVRSTFDLYC